MALWSLKMVVLLPHGRVFIRVTVGLVLKDSLMSFFSSDSQLQILHVSPLWEVVMGEKI